MKQIDECLDRLFTMRKPLNKKWRSFLEYNDLGEQILVIYHYHHLIMVVNLDSSKEIFAWFEKDADKRGLLSIIRYLYINKIISFNKGNLINIYNILSNTVGKDSALRFMTELKDYMENYSSG